VDVDEEVLELEIGFIFHRGGAEVAEGRKAGVNGWYIYISVSF
jgi:hypothetical protein